MYKQILQSIQNVEIWAVVSLLIFFIFFAAFLTYLLPAGEFERVKDEATGQTLVVENTFKSVEQSPVSILDIPLAIVHGLVGAADVVFFIFIIEVNIYERCYIWENR